MFTKLEVPQTLQCWDLTEAASHRRDQRLTPFPPLFPLWWIGDRAETSKLLILASSFWWTSRHAGATQEATQSHSGIYNGFRSSMSRTGLKTNLRARDVTSALLFRNEKVLGALYQELGAETNIYIYFFFYDLTPYLPVSVGG